MARPDGGPPPQSLSEKAEEVEGGWGDGAGKPTFWRQVKALFIKNW